jgi:cytochrome P450
MLDVVARSNVTNNVPPGKTYTDAELQKRAKRGEPLTALDLYRELAEYGELAFAQVGSLRVYFVNSPELAHEILVERADQFWKSEQLKQLMGGFREGLLVSDGDLWRRQRRLMQPAFHHRRIEQYAQTMTDYTDDMLSAWHNGDTLRIDREMTALTLNIITKTMFGADVSDQARRVGQMISALFASTERGILGLPGSIPVDANAFQAFTTIDSLLRGFINTRRRSGEDTGDLLSMLLNAVDESGKGMDDYQLFAELLTIFLAGHETTANALTWTWCLLAEHPHVEAKLVDELHTVLGGRVPTVADLPNLRYTEQVVKESMRLYPPAATLTRQPNTDIELGGYPIRKGELILISTYAMQHNPRLFADAETFRPERFSPQNEGSIPKYAYIPFGAGPRICIGNAFAMLEARLVLATVAQRYHMDLVPGQQITPVEQVTLRPKHGISMHLTARR